ncbi:TasA family protein [Agromyces sp. MMS24-JH15]|uniref:TasA family protein n=1 Tax=Agromyces sp. MMS24-JH15 TaxID=3243765 RepID=UPI003747E30B
MMRALIGRRSVDVRGARSWVLALATPVALLLAALLVYNASFAAFSAKSETAVNSFSTGTVRLWNDHVDHAVFDVSDLSPGDHAWAMVRVEYAGSLASTVKLYAQVDGDAEQDLAPYVELSFRETGSGATWKGTLDQFAKLTDYGTGVVPFEMAPTADGATRDAFFVIDYKVLENAPQDASASVSFVWEAKTH